MNRKSVGYYFAYLLPALHVLACLATFMANRLNLESGWEYVGLFDYPISIVPVGLAWRYRVRIPFICDHRDALVVFSQPFGCLSDR